MSEEKSLAASASEMWITSLAMGPLYTVGQVCSCTRAVHEVDSKPGPLKTEGSAPKNSLDDKTSAQAASLAATWLTRIGRAKKPRTERVQGRERR